MRHTYTEARRKSLCARVAPYNIFRIRLERATHESPALSFLGLTRTASSILHDISRLNHQDRWPTVCRHMYVRLFITLRSVYVYLLPLRVLKRVITLNSTS